DRYSVHPQAHARPLQVDRVSLLLLVGFVLQSSLPAGAWSSSNSLACNNHSLAVAIRLCDWLLTRIQSNEQNVQIIIRIISAGHCQCHVAEIVITIQMASLNFNSDKIVVIISRNGCRSASDILDTRCFGVVCVLLDLQGEFTGQCPHSDNKGESL